MAQTKEKPQQAGQATGRIAQVIGAVVDVAFEPGNLPEIMEAITVTDQTGRSVVLEVITRILFHTFVVFSVYLLFSGHNDPGGGFAGSKVTHSREENAQSVVLTTSPRRTVTSLME